MSGILERQIRIQANENGPFSSSNKNFSITIPNNMSYADLDRSYIELSIKLTTTDPDAGSGEGVYPANLRYKNSTLPMYNAGLLRRCNLTSDNQGRLESINDVNVLITNLKQMAMDRSEKESIGFKSCYQTFDKFGNKDSIFTNLNKEGTVSSSQKITRVPIMLKDLFGVCKIQDFDMNYSGALTIRCELDIANIVGFVSEPDLASDVVVNFTSQPSIGATALVGGGTGYAVGNTGTLTGSASGVEATYRVDTEAGGAIQTFTLTDTGVGFKAGETLTFSGAGNSDATLTITNVKNDKLRSTDDTTIAANPNFAVGRYVDINWTYNGVAANTSRAIVAVAQDTTVPAKLRLTVANIQLETGGGDVVAGLTVQALNSKVEMDDITAAAGVDQAVFDTKQKFSDRGASPFYVGQKVRALSLYTPNGGGATENINVLRLITGITYSNTTDKVNITLASGIKTLVAGDTLTNTTLLPTYAIGGVSPTVSNIDYLRADVVLIEKSEGRKADGYEYMTFETQNLNGNGNTDYNQQITLPAECSSALVVFLNNTQLYSDNSIPSITSWRCRVDGEFTTDREVVPDSPLYHDVIQQTLLNMDMDYSNNRGITSATEQDFELAESTSSRQEVVVGVHCPITASTKNFQMNVNSANGVNEVICYKHCIKQM